MDRDEIAAFVEQQMKADWMTELLQAVTSEAQPCLADAGFRNVRVEDKSGNPDGLSQIRQRQCVVVLDGGTVIELGARLTCLWDSRPAEFGGSRMHFWLGLQAVAQNPDLAAAFNFLSIDPLADVVLDWSECSGDAEAALQAKMFEAMGEAPLVHMVTRASAFCQAVVEQVRP